MVLPWVWVPRAGRWLACDRVSASQVRELVEVEVEVGRWVEAVEASAGVEPSVEAVAVPDESLPLEPLGTPHSQWRGESRPRCQGTAGWHDRPFRDFLRNRLGLIQRRGSATQCSWERT